MDFFLHHNDLSLSDRGVKGVLHFFLELDLAIPKENVTLSIHDLSQNISLFFLELRNVVLELDGLVFKFFELLLEVSLDIVVLVLELLLCLLVLIVKIIQLIHVEVKVFKSHLQLSDFFLMQLDLGIQTHLLFLKNGLLGTEVLNFSMNL